MRLAVVLSALLSLLAPRATSAQPPAHDHAAMAADTSWHLMQHAVVFLTINHQGSARGGDEIGWQNWWMGMAERRAGAGTLRLTAMFSVEPATLGKDGYREIFQAGETLDGSPLIDRQHPHDFLMQGSVAWRTPLGRGFALTLAGAPVGEPALGPVPFMHRASAADNPTAPLAHHSLDATHIAMGVLTAGLERGRWQVETSIFHGAEPDEQRWDLMDPGALDSWSVRAWFRPTPQWTVQASHGFLRNPEASEPGDVRRTTASAEWMTRRADGWTAAFVAYGRNNEIGGDFNAWLGEATHAWRNYSIYTRVEGLQVETDLLRFGLHGFVDGGRKNEHVPETGEGRDLVTMATIGATRTLLRPWGWNLAAGGDVAFYGVPSVLRPYYGDHPVSFHVFLRLAQRSAVSYQLSALSSQLSAISCQPRQLMTES